MKLGRAGRGILIGLVAVLGLSACSGDDDKDKPANSKGLEKTNLSVGVVPVPDAAPLQIAIDKGYFKEEGLNVKSVPIQASPVATPLLLNGSMDFALLNYVSTFVAQDKGAAKFKLVAESSQAVNESFAVLVPKNSSIRKPSDLKGKKIAIAASKSITHLLLTATLKSHGLAENDIKPIPLPLPTMVAALKKGSVDAIAAVEPFVTAAEKELGATVVADLIAGQTADYPIAGWGGTAEFAQKNPKTVAAFQRGMAKGLKDAQNRDEVIKVIPRYTKIKAETASVITIGKYPQTLSKTRMQRVADMLVQFGYTKNKVDAGQMIVAGP